MHANAIETIKRHVGGTVRNSVIENGWPSFNSYRKHLSSLCSELLKHKKNWIDIGGIFSIYISSTSDLLKEKFPSTQDVNGQLSELLDGTEFDDFVEYLTQFYCRIPIEYDVYFKLPNGSFSLPALDLSKNLSIVTFSKGDKIPWGSDARENGLLSLIDPAYFARPSVFLKTSALGYFSSSYKNQTARQAITNLKIAIFKLLDSNLIRISPRRPESLGLAFGITHHSIEKHYIDCVERQAARAQGVSVELPVDLSLFLSKFDINDDSTSPIAKISEADRPTVILGIFKAISALLDSTEDNAQRIKSAIEWFIDSYISENTTISFLQICISLEAIFGDEGASESVTRTLADRCAYLIGSSIDDRKIIRGRFEKLYKIRSKIVHGNIASLSEDEQHNLEWGRLIAQLSIQKEILNLKLI